MTVQRLIAQIRHERQRQGLTQEQLGDAAGYCRNAIYFLESGRRGVRLDTVIDCANALGLEIALFPKVRT